MIIQTQRKEAVTSSRLLGHGIGGRYPLGGGIKQLNRLPSSGQCLSSLSPLSVDSSFRIASSLSKHGICSLMLRGHIPNLLTATLGAESESSPTRLTLPASSGTPSSKSPTSNSSDMMPLSLRIPKRLNAS